jgi:hypothetical protein
MSQLSDPYLSSLHSDGLDRSSVLPDDTLSDLPNSPQAEQLIPSSLERLNDQTKSWVLYSNMTKEDFVNWWLTTQFGSKSDTKQMNWARKGYSSEVWAHFDQVADPSTGKPKAICKRCKRVYDHPNHTANGTTGLRRHLQKGSCKPTAKQVSIQQLIQQAVSWDESKVGMKAKLISFYIFRKIIQNQLNLSLTTSGAKNYLQCLLWHVYPSGSLKALNSRTLFAMPNPLLWSHHFLLLGQYNVISGVLSRLVKKIYFRCFHLLQSYLLR